MKLRQFYVYIMMNANNTATYIGVTNDLLRRVVEHRTGATKGFTETYKLTKLVYFDACDTAEQAIAREKQLKNWHRDWKLQLVESANPKFDDLAAEWLRIPNQVRNDVSGAA